MYLRTWTGLLIIATITVTATALSWEPLSPLSCNDKAVVKKKNECFRMTSEEGTCLNMTIEPCREKFSHHGHHGNHHSLWNNWWFPSTCMKYELTKCEVSKCVRGCCDGWTTDADGLCTVETNPKRRYCHNGGTAWGDECECPKEFTGPWCETPVCLRPCQNGGRCKMSADGKPMCACPATTTGTYCEKVKCPWECQNGAKCVLAGIQTMCQCQEGYVGNLCEIAMSDENQCPPPSTSLPCNSYNCRDRCRDSRDCTNGTLCCYDGCKRTCLQPLSKTCHYQGHYHKPGDTFTVDKCTNCTCLANGTVTCDRQQCPDLPAGCIPVSGGCCLKCHDDSSITGPRFGECPSELVRLDASFVSNVAYLKNLNLRAWDILGHSLKVNYIPDTLRHCRCPWTQRNISHVTAYADDLESRRAYCKFRVFVSDSSSPRFVTCPADIYAFEGEVVTWQRPVAVDNVGIMSLDTTDAGDRTFPVGNTSVSYIAWDFDGNQASCDFVVYVYKTGTAESSMPPGLMSRAYSSTTPILVGSLLGILALLALCLLAFVVMRRRRQRQSRPQRPPATVSTVSNGLYGQGNATSPVLPPAYSPPTNPPAYEEIHTQTDGSYKYESPPVYEAVDAHTVGDCGVGGKQESYDNPIYAS